MKRFIICSVIAMLLLSNSDCSRKKTSTVKYKGKLEIAAICMNYTVRVIEGKIDTSLVMANWTDETTQKSYTNVFKPGNPLRFSGHYQTGR
jgi:hypothetical protein